MGDRTGEKNACQPGEQSHASTDPQHLLAQRDYGRIGLRLIHLRQDAQLPLLHPVVGPDDGHAPVILVVAHAILAPQAGCHTLRVKRLLQRVTLTEPWLGDEEVEGVDQVGLLGDDQVASLLHDLRHLGQVQAPGQHRNQVAPLVLDGGADMHDGLLQTQRVGDSLDIGAAFPLHKEALTLPVLPLLLLVRGDEDQPVASTQDEQLDETSPFLEEGDQPALKDVPAAHLVSWVSLVP